VRLLNEAVTAYRQALLVYTREQLPQLWAGTQNNLGNALQAQGAKIEGQEGVRLLNEAVTAYRQALLVYTREQLPHLWATTQINLAQNFRRLKDWANAAQGYTNVLQVAPDHQQAYEGASFLYHEVLFNFQQAFALNQAWLESHPDDLSSLSDFAEKHFTTSRFDQFQQRISSLLNNEKVDIRTKMALRAIEIANLLALNKSNEVPLRINALIEAIASQPADFKLQWSFEGTKHFISQNERLATNRDWLEQLFTAMEGDNRDAIVTGLKAASARFTSPISPK
jgi:tetratricopeptide (TPR) repeat protein